MYEIWHLTTTGSAQSHGWVESAEGLTAAKSNLHARAEALSGENHTDCTLFVVDGNVGHKLQSGEVSPESALELSLERVVLPASE